MATEVKPIGKDRTYERWRWQIFFITWLAYGGFYLTRKSFWIAKVELAKPEVLGWTKLQMTWIDGAYSIAYAIGQFAWGMSGDRFGTRAVILIGMLASVITAALMGVSAHVLALGATLFCIQGLCQASGWAPLAKNIGEFFSQRERGRIMGFWCTNYAIGGLVASAVAGFAIEWAGQQRLAAYHPEQTPSLESVEKVATSQGLGQKAVQSIYGLLQIINATRLPPADAGAKLQQLAENEDVGGAIRARALESLHTLDDPRFEETLNDALKSGNAVVSENAKEIEQEIKQDKKKQIAAGDSSKVPSAQEQAKALQTIHDESLDTMRGLLGWRYAFFIPAAALFGIWLLFVLLQRNRPEDVGLPPIEEYHGEKETVLEEGETPAEEPEGSWKVIREVLTNRMVLLLAAVYFFLKPTRYLVLAWSPTYINERIGTGAAESGILGAMFEAAGPLGVLFGGIMSDVVFKSKRIPMSVIALALLAVLLFFFDDLPATSMALGLGFFGVGFLLYIPDSLVSATAAIDFGTKKGASTSAGLINGCGSVGQVIGITLPGWMEAIVPEGTYIWNYIFVGLSVSIGVAALLLSPRWNALPTPAKNNGK